MNPTAPPVVREVSAGPDIQIRLSPVVLSDGTAVRLDLRRFRRTGAGTALPTQAGFSIPVSAIRPLAASLRLALATPEAAPAVPLATNLELRLAAVVNVASGMLAGLDLRFYRSSARTGVYLPTRAGLFLLTGLIPGVADHLDALADDLGEPGA